MVDYGIIDDGDGKDIGCVHTTVGYQMMKVGHMIKVLW